MKKQFLRLVFTVGVGISSFQITWAQVEKDRIDLRFEDGTTVQLSLYGNEPKALFSNHIAAVALANHMGVTAEFSYSKIIAGKCMAKGGIYAGYRSGGFNGIFASGIYYLGTKEVHTKQSITVKTNISAANVTRYKAEVPCIKGKFWGIHGELGYNRIGYLEEGNFEPYNDRVYLVKSVGSGVIATGIGYNSFQGLHTKTEYGEYIGRTRLFTAIADVVYNPIMNVNATGFDTAAIAHELTPDDVERESFGFRAYLQWQNTRIYHKNKEVKGCAGYTWRIGLQSYNYLHQESFTLHLGESEIAPELGFGVFYNFW